MENQSSNSTHSSIASQSQDKVTMNSPPNTQSYAGMASRIAFPKKEQAIVIESIEGLTVHDYTVAVGKLVNPTNIRFVSRISQGRICLYLSSTELVTRLTSPGNNKITINSKMLEIRPLIANTQRIILSNVCPIIPHDVITEKLKEIGISLKSRLMFLKAGLNDPGYQHILSFRRQIFIDPADVVNLPGFIPITYDDTLYHIYISTEKISCFLCKNEGHIAKHCKEIDRSQNNIIDNNNIQEKLQGVTEPVHSEESNSQDSFKIPMETVETNYKRQLRSSKSSSIEKSEVENCQDKNQNPKKSQKRFNKIYF